MIFQSFKMAWKSIASSKMRSFLTMLGIIIGVFSLVVLVSLVNGATSSITDTISSIGTNLLTVTISDDKDRPFRWDEVTALADSEEFAEAAPSANANVTAKNKTASGSLSVTGTTPGYASIQGLELGSGRFLKTADVENHTYVAVINAYTAEELFGTANVTGETISLNGIRFQIVGVLAEEESTSGFNMERMEAYIPYTTLMRLSDSVKDVTSFFVSSADENSMDTAENRLTQLLLERLDSDSDAFSIQNQSEIMETMTSVTDTLSILLGGIAAISLIVGGIGIMNIMLVSVTERTREIGIRKAIGASYGTILTQFLIEALVISLIGCLIGIGISWLAILVVAQLLPDYSFSLSMGAVWVAVGFSALIGVGFGSYPASKAARKKPIDALQFT